MDGNDTAILGSGTKGFTAAAVLRLVDQGHVKLEDAVARVPARRQFLHTDCWSDPWKRAWLGMSIRFPDDDWGMKQFCIGFEHCATWSSNEAGSQHGAAVAATAAKKRFKDIDVPLPEWAHSDSTNSAVAIGKILELGCLKCLVHILAIASQRLLWEQFRIVDKAPVSRGKTPVVKFMEKCRAWALYL